MEEKEILSKAVDTIIQKPVTVTIDILNPKTPVAPKESLLTRLLIILKIRKRVVEEIETKRSFEIKGAPMGVLMKISQEFLNIGSLDMFSVNEAKMESYYHLIQENGEKMARIAAIAVSNKKDEPDQDLIDFFLDNLKAEELYKMALVVFQQMDIGNFLNTIILIKGANVLQSRTVSAMNASANEVSL